MLATLAPTHAFTKSGLGNAPFRVIGFFAYAPSSLAEHNPTAYMAANREASEISRRLGVSGGSCHHCGTALMNNYVIQSADGVNSVVGCDCVQKTGDAGIIRSVKALEKGRKAERSAARKAAEIAAYRKAARPGIQAQRKALLAEHGDTLRAAWAFRSEAFVRSILTQALSRGRLSEAQISAVERYLEQHATVAQRNADEAAQKATSKHVGEPGERLTLTLTLVRTISSKDAFNPWTLSLLVDDQGNCYRTFGKCDLDDNIPTKVKATVKDHGDRDGLKQTGLIRIKKI
jgi:hypothetical protein